MQVPLKTNDGIKRRLERSAEEDPIVHRGKLN
jgi:hypothetical protein